MGCKHQLSLCKLHDCKNCEYAGAEEACPFVGVDADESYPTFDEMCGVYLNASGRSRHAQSVVRYVQADIALVGLTGSCRSTMMTRSRFKTLVQLLCSVRPDGTVLRGETVKSHLAAFRSVSSERLEDRFNDIGRELPSFSIPKFTADRTKVQEISDRTVRKVEIEMEKWLASGTESNVSAYIFCFFALYCGMRAGDICEAKWSILRQTTAGMMVTYTPHKTLHSTGVTVSFPVDSKTFVKIEPLVGAPGDYVIPRHDERVGTGTRRDGRYCGTHGYLRRKVNRMLSVCGIGNEYRGQKKSHALRKYFSTDSAFSVGKAESARRCGHSEDVQRRNYLGSLLGKVS